MKNNHERKNHRHQTFNYQRNGYYFITICTNHREHLFGMILNGHMVLNQYGKIIREELLKTQNIRPNSKIDTFVIMPNHIHLILKIKQTPTQTEK